MPEPDWVTHAIWWYMNASDDAVEELPRRVRLYEDVVVVFVDIAHLD